MKQLDDNIGVVLKKLEEYGIEVAGRVPHIFEANVHNRGYLLTKARRSGHLLALEELEQPKPGTNGARLSIV